MPAPTVGKVPAQPRSVPTRPGRRVRVALVATALVVLASAIGVSVALANRPMDPQAPPQERFTAAQPAPGQSPSSTPQAATEPGPPADSTAGAQTDKAAKAAKALPDGHHNAYITKIGRDSIVVDLVQVFEDDAAVEAAIEDGVSRENARFRTTYVRNQNPRLRTLPLAGDLRIELRDVCDEPGPGQDALLAKLAANARLGGTYYYTLTVSDGAVERIQERLAVNAC
jgi:hypothetical protein